MQNMKLLDLQTGKYLELGKDWLYGGEYIVINTCKIGYSVYEAIQHKDSEKFFKYDKDCLFTDELNEPLKTLCEKTGAVVYGGRYVLLNEIDVWVYNNDLEPQKIKTGDIVKEKTSYMYNNRLLINVADFFLDTTENIKTTHKIGKKTFSKFDFFAIENILGNIFEEYSKQLRNEPNKFNVTIINF